MVDQRDASSGTPLPAPAAASPLTRLATGEPCAVLLVDLTRAQVVYANDLARQLAPEVSLPADVAAWSRHAGLLDQERQPLEATATPLVRVASGQPVNGELVTAQRGSDMSQAREDLWVVGTPLRDAPAPLGERALVVFLPLRDSAVTVGDTDSVNDLRHRAVLAAETSFTISDPSVPDNPLVWINPAFERTTGYTWEQVIGRNCRFLQGPLTDATAIARIRQGLADGSTIDETILNYRADGTVFWNHLVISPVFDATGGLTHHVGVQTDVTARIEADAAREAALATAKSAIARQRTIAAISAGLSEQITHPDDFVRRASALVAAHLSATVAVILTPEHGGVAQIAAADPPELASPDGVGRSRSSDLLVQRLRAQIDGVLDLVSDPQSRWPALLPLSDAPTADGDGPSPRDVLAAPMRVRGRVEGLLVVAPADDRFEDLGEIDAVTDIATRVATALDNARLYAAARDTALTLQRSLLPTLPSLDRFDIAAAYVPAAEADEVGGDWFDVLELPEHWIGVTVGDVAGHDIAAAARMGQLRSMVRTLAWEGHRPQELITKLDGLVRNTQSAVLTTLFYALIDNPEEAAGPGETAGDAAPTCRITYASAGHLPALLRHVDGTVHWLDKATTTPVGVYDTRSVNEATVAMPVGSTLVLYTDGLVERRGQDLQVGLDALVELLSSSAADAAAQDVRDLIVDNLIDVNHADDTCVLVIRRRT